MGHPVRAALLATTCIAATTAHAQDDSVFLGTLRIEAAQAQAVLGNDQITEDEIERRNPKTTKDVFVGESSISASGGAAIAQKVFVSGIEESLLSETIDGARQHRCCAFCTDCNGHRITIDDGRCDKVAIFQIVDDVR